MTVTPLQAVYVPSVCECDRWRESMPQIIGAQQLAGLHGVTYTGAKFNFCPWCGRHIAQPVTDVRDVSDEAILRKAIDELTDENARLREALAAAPRWVSVTERLPEQNGEYPVDSHECQVAEFFDGEWRRYDGVGDCVTVWDVQHWYDVPPAPGVEP